MAQYGKNFYGASHYGASGIFTGQFVSDETSLLAPINNQLTFDIEAMLDGMAYKYDNEIFRYNGNWTVGAASTFTSDNSAKAIATLSASDVSIKFVQRADGALASIKVTRYVNGAAQAPNTYTLDTASAATLSIPNTTINGIMLEELVIEISKDASANASTFIELDSITAITTDVILEIRTTTHQVSEGQWDGWALAPLTRTYNSGTYSYTATLAISTSINGYQFKLMLGSSDTTTGPEIRKLDIHTTQTSDYSSGGTWKMAIDLGTTVDEIESVTYTATEPSGTSVEIRTRTTADTAIETAPNIDTVSWDYWTVPYSHSDHRITVDIRRDQALKTGYVITPLMTPENLTHWLTFIPTMFTSRLDPATGATNSNTSVTIEFLDDTLTPITVNGDKQSFTFFDYKDAITGISGIDKPCRAKITLNRELGYASPAVDNLYLQAEAEYTEVRTFGDGGIESYASAVFGDNTGKDAVYMDGVGRTQLASVSNFAFTKPTGVTNPDYIIDNVKMPGYTSEQLKLYWASEASNESKDKAIKLENGLADDHVMAEVNADGEQITKHRQYGSGITLKVGNETNTIYDTHVVSNVFSASLATDTRYAYHIANGFSADTTNPNVDIRWAIENTVPDDLKRNVVYAPGQQVNVSISQTTIGGLADWKSEEKIFSGIVNEGSPVAPRTTRITLDSTLDLPEIGGEIVIDENPYRVEVVDGSVVSEGETRENSRINIEIDNSLNTYIPVTEEKVKIIKSATSQDYLPKSRTLDIEGIYTLTNQYAPIYVPGVHFTLVDGRVIDWSIGIDNMLEVPAAGDTLYITYTYEKIYQLTMLASSDYNRSEYDALNIYRTQPILNTGRCSRGVDYESGAFNITQLWPDIPSTVDKNTLNLKAVVADNDMVNAYVKDNHVIGTLSDVNPRNNWHPHIKEGFYYIGKDGYHLFTSPYTATLDRDAAPMAENIVYVDGQSQQGVLIQEGTANILKNTTFNYINDGNRDWLFIDSFGR